MPASRPIEEDMHPTACTPPTRSPVVSHIKTVGNHSIWPCGGFTRSLRYIYILSKIEENHHSANLERKPHFGVLKPHMSSAVVTADTIQSRWLNWRQIRILVRKIIRGRLGTFSQKRGEVAVLSINSHVAAGRCWRGSWLIHPYLLQNLSNFFFFCSFGNVSERGKDLLISTIREFIILTLYFEVTLNMTRVMLRQTGKEMYIDAIYWKTNTYYKIIPYKPIIYINIAQHCGSVICYNLCISTGKAAQHFTFTNLFIFLIIHIFLPSFIIVCLSSSSSTSAFVRISW